MHNHSYSANIIIRKNFTKKDGTHPLLLRVIINRKVCDMSLGIAVRPEHFNEEKQEIKIPKETKQSQDHNLVLLHVVRRASEIFTDYRLMDISLTVAIFKEAFENRTSRFDFIQFMEKEILEEKKIREKVTINTYNQAVFWLKKYFKDGLPFSNITVDNMDRYHKYQQTKKLSPNTIYKHRKNINKFINIAIQKGIRIKSPYGQLKISKVPTEKHALTKEHLLRLIDLYNEKVCPAGIQNVLAMFIFSALCGGIRFSDLQHFLHSNIIENTLVFIPKKIKRFNRVVKVPIPDYAQEFIMSNRGSLFDKISNKAANEHLKVIQNLTDIPILLTTHVARHTFATLFLEADGETQTLMDIMGISKYETIKVYIHIANSRKKQSMKKYESYIKAMPVPAAALN